MTIVLHLKIMKKVGLKFFYLFHTRLSTEVIMNILLVDDDRFIIEALREKINWAKLHIDIVYVAYSLTQAQNIIREHPIDL